MVLMEFVGISLEEFIGNMYIQSVSILVFFFIGAKLITFIVEKYLLKLTAKTKTEVDDLLVEKTHGPISLLFFLIGVKLALIPLKLEEGVKVILHRLDSTLSILVLLYALIVIMDILISAWVKRKARKKEKEVDHSVIKLGERTSRVIILIIGFLFILKVWNIELGPLLASLGILGVAVAFGLQNTLGNIFGGVSLLLDRSIKVGDIVKIDTDTYGQVIDVGLRATRVRSWDNEVVIIPNGKLAGVNIKNYVLPNPAARIIVPFSVAYGSNVDKIKKIVLKEIKKLDTLDKNKEPSVMFLEMGDSALKFKAFVWLRSYKDRFSTKERLNCAIYNALKKNRVNIPFPQIDVHVKKK